MEGKGNIQEGDLLDPTPELPDDTPLNRVQFPTRVQSRPTGLSETSTSCWTIFGSLGRVWRETDEAGTNRTWMIRNLLEGQYENPVRIIAFNIAGGWCRGVTLEIADELRRSYPEFDEVPASVFRFLETTNRH